MSGTTFMKHGAVVPGAVAILPNGDCTMADELGRVEVRDSMVRWLLSEGWTVAGSPAAEQAKAIDRKRLALMKAAMKRPISAEQAHRAGIYAAMMKYVPQVKLGAIFKRHLRA